MRTYLLPHNHKGAATMPYLERRANLWYATLTIPKDARTVIGKFKFIKSLGTPSKATALRLAAPLLAKWRAEIEQARGKSDAVLTEALRWKDSMAAAREDERGTLALLLSDRAESIEFAKGLPAAQSFYGIASGQHTPSALHLGEWKAQIALTPKTKDRMVKDVELVAARFPVLEEITKKAVRRWLTEELRASRSSAARIASNARNLWRYLQFIHAAPDDAPGPFAALDLSRTMKKETDSWVPFTAEEVVALWQAARDKKDNQLADLIALGAYTGARIESLCSAKVADIKAHVLHISDDKTKAGTRDVPIHYKLQPLVARLVQEASRDGYLLSGLTFNKYGDRSNAIGKRFGGLKRRMGFSTEHVFHSIRKTLVTLLQNAKVDEPTAADIVGHEKPTMTYGLYSGGASIEVKREALGRIKYPFKGPLK